MTYAQIPATQTWSGEAGGYIYIGDKRYSPTAATAYLLVSAVVDADGLKYYLLKSSAGGMWERDLEITPSGDEAEVGEPRRVDELLIAADAGLLLGAVAVTVGELWSPVAGAKLIPQSIRARAATLSYHEPHCLGSLLLAYQTRRGISRAQLAELLECRAVALDNLALCYAPRPHELEGAGFGEYVAIVAEFAGASRLTLSHVVAAVLVERTGSTELAEKE